MKIAMCLLVGVIGLVVVRSAVNDGFQRFVGAVGSNPGTTCVSMLGNTTREENGLTYIVGTIQNTCRRPISSVTVIFKLDRPQGSFDGSRAIIYAYSRDLQPGESREFKSFLTIPKNSTYTFDKITGF